MPIATCYWNPREGALAEVDLAALWADAAGIAVDEVTVQVVQVARQTGRPYAVIAELLLPDLWSDSRRAHLALGLAQVLVDAAAADPDRVLVHVRTIPSGSVVEGGALLRWGPEPDTG